MDLQSVEMALGWWICHQDPVRTLSLGESTMPLCARCTAIYHFTGIALLAGLVAGRPASRWALPAAAGAAVAGVAIVLGQWLGSQAGLWASNFTNRILSGLACGGGLGWLLHTALGLRLVRRRGSPWLGALLFAAGAGASLAIMLAAPPWSVAAHVIGIGSLAGFLAAAAWGQAILLTYVFRTPGDEPRRALITATVAVAVAFEAVAMSLVRI